MMNEREKVLLQREAVRAWLLDHHGPVPIPRDIQAEIRALFPLPPKREPRVVRGDDREWRIDPVTGLLQDRVLTGFARSDRWWNFASDADNAAIRAVAASPYIEVPDPEDAE